MVHTNNKHYHLTQSGVDELKKELIELKRRRLAVAAKLKDAREEGDLGENAAWDEAQEEFKYVEGRFDEIDHILSNLKIIKNPHNPSQVMLGSVVELSQNGKKTKYTIVGSLEANPESGKISNDSPLGKALMNKKLGESVEITTPAGSHSYKITKIT